MKTADIRQKFLHFFQKNGHTICHSSSLVPWEDPTLLFTNAGMNQFKDTFLGLETRAYQRATTSQKCVRAGGKHNDLENVGYTARHHTFFEMLGNFSFGDYFKREAIQFAWNFLTSVEDGLGLPKEKLMVTVYATDDEAFDIWHQEIGIPVEKIVRIGDNKGAPYASDNFWTMGDTGPCGPCTEIFYDHGAHIAGGPPGSPEEDGDRFIEIWNNVFMQFNRDEKGVLHPLPKPSVDTGMGLERISAIMQHVHANYEIDLFVTLLKAAARETGVPYNQETPSLKVIADHIRACSFLVADGVLPSNEGRGYVLRRIIRRAIRHGYKLNQKGTFFYKIVPDLVAEMGDAYPELRTEQQKIMQVLEQEEIRFADTLEKGMLLLDGALAGGKKALDGASIFKLYDTFGFPVDLTADICRERNIELDLAGFEVEMASQRNRARATSAFKVSANVIYDGTDSAFHGYEQHSRAATILALYQDGVAVLALEAGATGIIVLDNTPFYAEGGGQVGDVGLIVSGTGQFKVLDTQKIKAQVFGQVGFVEAGVLRVGETVMASVDLASRQATARNHSATHLLHSALLKILGTHVAQKGSLVNPERTRFDFTHTEPLSSEIINAIEAHVNAAILDNAAIEAQTTTYELAIAQGAIALFGEKYGDDVRVLSMGEHSTELCGGVHASHTGDIGLFKIVSEGGVAAGIRRIEAVTGVNALVWVQQQDDILKNSAALLQVHPTEFFDKLTKLQAELKSTQKEIATLKSQMAFSQLDGLLSAGLRVIHGVKALASVVEGMDAATLRDMSDKVMDNLCANQSEAVVLLASVTEGKVSLIARVSKGLTKQVKAGELVNWVAEQVGGKGGGRPDMAQAGGTKPENLAPAMRSTEIWLTEKLQGLSSASV